MDQFVSCMGKAGHAFFLDCRSLEFKFVPIPSGIRLVVCNTKVKHDLATGAYNTRREECEEGVRYFAKWDPSVHALRDVSVELLETARQAIFRQRSRNDAPTSSTRTSGRSMPPALWPKATCQTCGRVDARVAPQPARSLRGELPRT